MRVDGIPIWIALEALKRYICKDSKLISINFQTEKILQEDEASQDFDDEDYLSIYNMALRYTFSIERSFI